MTRVALVVLALLLLAAAATPDDVYTELQAFARALSTIENGYVDRVPTRRLIDAAITGMVTALDPYSQYVPKETYRRVRGETADARAELGLDCERAETGLRVLSVYPDSPADKSGLLPGDLVLALDGKPAPPLEALLGPPGSRVTLRVHREGFVVPRDFVLAREALPPNPLKVAWLGPALHARLGRFTEGSAKALIRAVQQHKPAGLVLDLRDNQGGLVEQAVQLVDAFVERGLILSTVGRDGKQLDRYQATPKKTALRLPLVVLVNGNSASAAEIVAAALQDLGRAKVAGARTYGKASVQTIVELEGGGALKLTTGRYLTLKQHDIDKRGVMPDVSLDKSADWVAQAALLLK